MSATANPPKGGGGVPASSILFDWDPDDDGASTSAAPASTTVQAQVPSVFTPTLPPPSRPTVAPVIRPPARGFQPIPSAAPRAAPFSSPLPANAIPSRAPPPTSAQILRAPNPGIPSTSLIPERQNVAAPSKEDYAAKMQRGSVVSFGIGGQIVLSFPPSLYGATGYFARGAGPVEIVPLSAAIKGSQMEVGLSSYPGPLTSAKTSDVIQFLRKKLDNSTSLSEVERLLLKFLSVYASKQGVMDSDSFTEMKHFVSQDVHSSGAHNTTNLEPPQDAAIIFQIEHHLLKGNIVAAHSLALQNRLWSHALLLSQYVGFNAFQDTVSKYAVSFAEKSPLRTLYLIEAGNLKSAFQSLSDKTFPSLLSLWKQSLALILSNFGRGDKQAVAQLAEVAIDLDPVAAHICFLLGEPRFEKVNDPDPKLVLLGGDHIRHPRTFTSVTAIQYSEIVEFALRQNNPNYSIPSIQIYKMMLAMQYAEMGALSTAMSYVTSISNIIKSQPKTFVYSPAFAREFTEFSKRVEVTLRLNKNFESKSASSLSVGSIMGSLFGGVSKLIAGDEVGSKEIEVVGTLMNSVPPIVRVKLVETAADPVHVVQPPSVLIGPASPVREASPFLLPVRPVLPPSSSQFAPRIPVAGAPQLLPAKPNPAGSDSTLLQPIPIPAPNARVSTSGSEKPEGLPLTPSPALDASTDTTPPLMTPADDSKKEALVQSSGPEESSSSDSSSTSESESDSDTSSESHDSSLSEGDEEPAKPPAQAPGIKPAAPLNPPLANPQPVKPPLPGVGMTRPMPGAPARGGLFMPPRMGGFAPILPKVTAPGDAVPSASGVSNPDSSPIDKVPVANPVAEPHEEPKIKEVAKPAEAVSVTNEGEADLPQVPTTKPDESQEKTEPKAIAPPPLSQLPPKGAPPKSVPASGPPPRGGRRPGQVVGALVGPAPAFGFTPTIPVPAPTQAPDPTPSEPKSQGTAAPSALVPKPVAASPDSPYVAPTRPRVPMPPVAPSPNLTTSAPPPSVAPPLPLQPPPSQVPPSQIPQAASMTPSHPSPFVPNSTTDLSNSQADEGAHSSEDEDSESSLSSSSDSEGSDASTQSWGGWFEWRNSGARDARSGASRSSSAASSAAASPSGFGQWRTPRGTPTKSRSKIARSLSVPASGAPDPSPKSGSGPKTAVNTPIKESFPPPAAPIFSTPSPPKSAVKVDAVQTPTPTVVASPASIPRSESFAQRILIKLGVTPKNQGKQAHLGEENTFYFNKEMNMWVERGKEEEYKLKAAGPAPPPKASQTPKVERKDEDPVSPGANGNSDAVTRKVRGYAGVDGKPIPKPTSSSASILGTLPVSSTLSSTVKVFTPTQAPAPVAESSPSADETTEKGTDSPQNITEEKKEASSVTSPPQPFRAGAIPPPTFDRAARNPRPTPLVRTPVVPRSPVPVGKGGIPLRGAFAPPVPIVFPVAAPPPLPTAEEIDAVPVQDELESDDSFFGESTPKTTKKETPKSPPRKPLDDPGIDLFDDIGSEHHGTVTVAEDPSLPPNPPSPPLSKSPNTTSTSASEDQRATKDAALSTEDLLAEKVPETSPKEDEEEKVLEVASKEDVEEKVPSPMKVDSVERVVEDGSTKPAVLSALGVGPDVEPRHCSDDNR